MNYRELLRRMPGELRSRLEAETVYVPWFRRGYTLEQIWLDQEAMETLLGRLGSAQRQVLEAIVRHIGVEPFDTAELEPLAGLLSAAEVRAALAGLLRKGLVFAFRKTWGERICVLPEEAFELWSRVLLSGLSNTDFAAGEAALSSGTQALRVRTPAAIQLAAAPPADLADDLFVTLVLAAREGLRLTKHGTIHKKQLAKLIDSLRLRADALSGLALKYGYSDTYPLPAAVVLDLLLRLQLLVPGSEELTLHRDRLKAWLSLSEPQRTAQLYRLWKSLTLPPEAWQQHAVLLTERIAAGEGFAPKTLICRLESEGLIAQSDRPELGETLASIFANRWLEPLRAFGWLEREEGVPSGGETVYRWLKHPLTAAEEDVGEPEPAAKLIVQPDFDVFAPPDLPLAVRWELNLAADLTARDQMSVYKLSKAGIKRAWENGRPPERLLAFLNEHGLYPVPDNVAVTVAQWAKPLGQTAFASCVLLRCADETAAETVSRLPGAAELLLERLGGRDYIIRPERRKELAALLEKSGMGTATPAADQSGASAAYPDALGGLALAPGEAETLLTAADKGLIYARTPAVYFPMEARPPEAAELYPEMNQIPASWLKDYRNYHVSTRREMVEKAIEWKTLLQIRRGGDDYRIAPRKLLASRGSWCMTGRGTPGSEGGETAEIRWQAEEWQEMKLILPGINDKY